jgi:hypothetical protein
MSYFIASLNIVLIGWLTWWISKRTAKDQVLLFWSALAVRLCAGIALGLVYFYYYTVGDTIGFFHDAIKLRAMAMDDPGGFMSSIMSGVPPIELANREPRSFFFTLLLTLANILSGDNYWIASLWFSMFSFCCAWYFVKVVSEQLPGLRKAAVISFLFWPSVVFWSSGIVKESVAFGSLTFLAGIFVSQMNNKRLHVLEYVAGALATWLLLGLKYYWAALFIPSVATCLVVHWFVARRGATGWKLIAAWFAIFVIFCLAASFTHPNFYLPGFLDVIRSNYNEFVAISKPDNLISFPRPVESWVDVMVNAPWALLSGLFRPFIFESASVTGLLSSLENFVMLGLTIASLANVKRLGRFEGLLVLTTITYVSLLCIFLSLSTPNFGTLSRYRVGFLPFFVMLIMSNNPLVNSKVLRWRTQISTFTK